MFACNLLHVNDAQWDKLTEEKNTKILWFWRKVEIGIENTIFQEKKTYTEKKKFQSAYRDRNFYTPHSVE